METKDTIASNALIAEFLGYFETETGYYYNHDLEKGFAKNSDVYLTSWDWLMPVVEKIEGLSKAGETYMVSITKISVRISFKGSRLVDLPIDDTKIEAVYNAVIEFIKCYNQNKQHENI